MMMVYLNETKNNEFDKRESKGQYNFNREKWKRSENENVLLKWTVWSEQWRLNT